jgi:threonine aldolase
MNFASDNWAGAAPEIVDAIATESRKYAAAYSESDLDRQVALQFSDIFEREVAVLFVGTGSAANALAMSSVARPGGVIFCHRESHMIEDECGGVEFLTGGARLQALGGRAGKVDPGELQSAIDRFVPDFVHSGQPMAVSITQQNEAGGIYALDEIRTISTIARQRGLPLHMDGARFANALVRLGVSPAEMTWKAGVDLLSFGASKNGCIAAEAIVFFDPAMAAQAPYLRKRAGQLFSKSRFIAAQFDAYFRDGLWMRLAGHANVMADRLRTGLSKSEKAREAWPTDGNEVFAILRQDDAERLRTVGGLFYDWSAPQGAALDLAEGEIIVRLVTSFATQPGNVDRFLIELSA